MHLVPSQLYSINRSVPPYTSYRYVLPPSSATINMYQFHGTVGIFYVLAASDKQQAICDHVFAQKGDVIRAVVVAPTDRESHSSRPDQEPRVSHQRGRLLDPRLSVTQKRSRVPQLSPGVNDLQWHTSQGAPAIDAEAKDGRHAQDESQAKKADDDSRVGTGHLRHEYRVMMQFKDDTRTKVKRWAAKIFATASKEIAFRVSMMHALPRTKDADIRIVEAMRATNSASEGHFELTIAAILFLAAVKGYTRQQDEEAVRTLIGKHYYAYQRNDESVNDILNQWRKAHSIQALGNHTCDPPLKGFTFREPFDVWKTWVDTYIHHLHPVPFRKKALVLCGRTMLGKTPWARSLGPHIYMKKSFDLQKLHDCLAEGKAKYVVLDEFEWENITGKNKGTGKYGPSIVISDGNEFTWGTTQPRMRTKQTLPVIVLHNVIPEPNNRVWTLDGWSYWKEQFVFARLPENPTIHLTCPDASTSPSSSPVLAASPSSLPVLSASPSSLPVLSASPSSLPVLSASPSSLPVLSASPSSLPVLSASPSPSTSSSPSSSPAPPSPCSSTPVRDRLRRTITQRRLAALQFNKANLTRYGPDCHLITDWLYKQDADRQLAAWEQLASQFRLMKHRGNPLARWKAFYCNVLAGSRTSYEYTSSELEAWEEYNWPPEGLQLRDAVSATLDENVNSLVANDYRHKKHKITWHFDKPADIAHGTSIATVSLGHPRVFQLCLTTEVQRWMADKKARADQMKRNKEQGIKEKLPAVTPLAGVIDIVLPHGSIFVIGPQTNALYMHCIPPSKEECGRRYGLTFRTIASRWLPDVEVVIRQPPKGQTAWDVVYRAKETRKGEALGQNGYAYRSRAHLEQYTPRDPRRLTEEDINAVRASMPGRPKLKGKPSREDYSDAEAEDDVTMSDDDLQEASCADEKVAVAPTVVTVHRGRRGKGVKRKAAAAE